MPCARFPRCRWCWECSLQPTVEKRFFIRLERIGYRAVILSRIVPTEYATAVLETARSYRRAIEMMFSLGNVALVSVQTANYQQWLDSRVTAAKASDPTIGDRPFQLFEYVNAKRVGDVNSNVANLDNLANVRFAPGSSH